jgi:hypothetical protein
MSMVTRSRSCTPLRHFIHHTGMIGTTIPANTIVGW